MASGAFAAPMGDGPDPTAIEGVTRTPYDVPKMEIDLRMPTNDIPTSTRRS